MSTPFSSFWDRFLKPLTKSAAELRSLLRDAENRATQAGKLSTESAKWAQDSDAGVKRLTKALAELRTWAEAAEQKVAVVQADEFEKWARRSDTMLVAANARIAELEKYLGKHREWALRCEAELAQSRNRAEESAS